MKAGRLSEAMYKRSILKQLHSKSDCVLSGPGVGLDFSVFSSLAGSLVACSGALTTVERAFSARRTATYALNKVACSGALPVGLSVSIFLPTASNETELRSIMKEIDDTAKAASAQILDVQTQICRGLCAPLVSVTGFGAVRKNYRPHPSLVKPGMDIVVSGYIGADGTSVLAAEMQEALLARYAQPFIDKAKQLSGCISIWSEAAVAAESGAIAMHAVAEGGIFGALWEFAEASGVGLEIELKKIPIRQETVEISEFFDINPYKMVSGGCILMAAEDGGALVKRLLDAQIPAVVIGKATAGNDRVLVSDGERRFLETAQPDELYRVMASK